MRNQSLLSRWKNSWWLFSPTEKAFCTFTYARATIRSIQIYMSGIALILAVIANIVQILMEGIGSDAQGIFLFATRVAFVAALLVATFFDTINVPYPVRIMAYYTSILIMLFYCNTLYWQLLVELPDPGWRLPVTHGAYTSFAVLQLWFLPFSHVVVLSLCQTTIFLCLGFLAYSTLDIRPTSAILETLMMALCQVMALLQQYHVSRALHSHHRVVTEIEATARAIAEEKRRLGDRIRAVLPPFVHDAVITKGDDRALHVWPESVVIVVHIILECDSGQCGCGPVVNAFNTVFSVIESMATEAGLAHVTRGGPNAVLFGESVNRNRVYSFLTDLHDYILDHSTMLKVGVSTGTMAGGITSKYGLRYDVWGHPLKIAWRLIDICHSNQIMFDSPAAHAILVGQKPEGVLRLEQLEVRGIGLVTPYAMVLQNDMNRKGNASMARMDSDISITFSTSGTDFTGAITDRTDDNASPRREFIPLANGVPIVPETPTDPLSSGNGAGKTTSSSSSDAGTLDSTATDPGSPRALFLAVDTPPLPLAALNSSFDSASPNGSRSMTPRSPRGVVGRNTIKQIHISSYLGPDVYSSDRRREIVNKYTPNFRNGFTNKATRAQLHTYQVAVTPRKHLFTILIFLCTCLVADTMFVFAADIPVSARAVCIACSAAQYLCLIPTAGALFAFLQTRHRTGALVTLYGGPAVFIVIRIAGMVGIHFTEPGDTRAAVGSYYMLSEAMFFLMAAVTTLMDFGGGLLANLSLLVMHGLLTATQVLLCSYIPSYVASAIELIIMLIVGAKTRWIRSTLPFSSLVQQELQQEELVLLNGQQADIYQLIYPDSIAKSLLATGVFVPERYSKIGVLCLKLHNLVDLSHDHEHAYKVLVELNSICDDEVLRMSSSKSVSKIKAMSGHYFISCGAPDPCLLKLTPLVRLAFRLQTRIAHCQYGSALDIRIGIGCGDAVGLVECEDQLGHFDLFGPAADDALATCVSEANMAGGVCASNVAVREWRRMDSRSAEMYTVEDGGRDDGCYRLGVPR
ncbi:hypothetical protein J8273_3133 [Carpediemonas membranifera]|uniref:adenylate cyclase n=1 Tax=Carpediemonas membranifera TaxID=201153 RepID=A0A8J6BZI2_9EUKA|nr:hypothetical protein J8273_3133 [Carpediemonas membranifera]|eukprot:KAG9395556.1 hypothetical protein J8273_3133 [Carpediemonas membranifera]